MAGATLFTLLDDIASILDDVSVMSQVAVKKTAGVLGDDLALNAKQVTGLSADRELPVVWKVAVGSAINKAILIPAALAISAIAPWAIKPLLMLGGIYLCFEGVEKILHNWLHRKSKHQEDQDRQARVQAMSDPDVDPVKLEKDKIQGAIRTDFILSAEIIVITLGTLAGQTFAVTMGVLLAIGILMTVGVYGLVAGIVKLDDLGLHLLGRAGTSSLDQLSRRLGAGILWMAPYLLRFLAVAGTAAMFLVGGGIITHQFESLHHWSESFAQALHAIPVLGGPLSWLAPAVFDFVFGILAGAAVVGLIQSYKFLFGSSSEPHASTTPSESQ
jgi:predicted DNA repair protein MutK